MNEKNHLGEQVIVSGAAMEDYSSLCVWGIREHYCFVSISHAQTKFGLQVCFQSQPTLWPWVKYFPVPPLLPPEDGGEGDTHLLHKVPHKWQVSLHYFLNPSSSWTLTWLWPSSQWSHSGSDQVRIQSWCLQQDPSQGDAEQSWQVGGRGCPWAAARGDLCISLLLLIIVEYSEAK